MPALDRLPPRSTPGTLRAVIETPEGTRNKIKFDPTDGAMRITESLPAGMSFPFDFGFVPGTLAADGDPLDVLVLMDGPGFPGQCGREPCARCDADRGAGGRRLGPERSPDRGRRRDPRTWPSQTSPR